MARDINGTELKVGDKVTIPATVVDIPESMTDDYVNLRVEFDHIMPPYTDKSSHDLNSRQVEKQGDPN